MPSRLAGGGAGDDNDAPELPRLNAGLFSGLSFQRSYWELRHATIVVIARSSA